jgi:uncharacterized protein YqgC (DUF456 family)
LYYVWASLLILANGSAWLSNSLSLPGNWLIVALTASFAFFYSDQVGPGVGWGTVILLIILATVGEVIEFMAGALLAGKRGGSRRGMMLAVVGTFLGSIGGAFISLPVPIVGPMVGALAGGAVGAFSGAWIGEMWKGRAWLEGYDIGKAAMIGRLLGTAGKLILGAMMVVIATIDALWN